jgi:hypothetical protein
MGTIGGSTVVQAAAINSAGVAVGRALVAGEFVGWRWTESGGIEELPLPDGEVTFEPNDINAAGDIVGHVFEFVAPEGFYRSYVYDGSTFTPLAMDGFTSALPHAISDDGLVVGWVDVEGSDSRTPAAWDLGSGDATAFPLFEESAFTNELEAVATGGLALGITREGDDFDRTWIVQISPDLVPSAPPAEPAPVAPTFTG